MSKYETKQFGLRKQLSIFPVLNEQSSANLKARHGYETRRTRAFDRRVEVAPEEAKNISVLLVGVDENADRVVRSVMKDAAVYAMPPAHTHAIQTRIWNQANKNGNSQRAYDFVVLGATGIDLVMINFDITDTGGKTIIYGSFPEYERWVRSKQVHAEIAKDETELEKLLEELTAKV